MHNLYAFNLGRPSIGTIVGPRSLYFLVIGPKTVSDHTPQPKQNSYFMDFRISHRRYSIKKVFLKISQNSREATSFLKRLQPLGLHFS